MTEPKSIEEVLKKELEIQTEAPPVSDHRRILMFKVLGDSPLNPWLLDYLRHFNNLTHCDDLLKWLIRNQLTGKRFVEFLMENGWLQKGKAPSFLEPIKYIYMRMRKDSEARHIMRSDYVI